MMSALQHRLLIALALVVLVLAVAAAALFHDNRQAQGVVAARGDYIQQSLQLEPVYQSIVRTLAELAVANDDAQVAQLLASQGIRLTPGARPQPPAAAAPAAPKTARSAPPAQPAAKPGKP